jgi:DNA topoisomerase-1
VQLGDEGARGSIPPDLAPDELTLDVALELARRQAEGPQTLGDDPESGLPVFVLNGRFGPYVQLGETNGSSDKPRRASLFKTMQPESVTLQQALELLSLPRVVGAGDDGEEIVALNGRYGPYIKKGADTRSLDSEDKLLTVTLPEALALLATPKTRGRVAKPPIAELGESPDTGAAVRVLDGRFGAYVTDGATNATVPRGTDPEALTLPEAVALLRARAAAGPSKRATKKKAPAKKAPAKKAAKAKKAKKAKKAPGAKKADGDKVTAPPAMKVAKSTDGEG